MNLIWVTYNYTNGIAKVHIDKSIRFDIFVEAFQNKFPSMASCSRGRGKGKGKGTDKHGHQADNNQEARVQYPFTFQFLQVSNRVQAYDEHRIVLRSEVVE